MLVFMQTAALPKLIYAILAACGLIYFSMIYPQMPDVVASHFNGAGTATAFMPKSGFLIIILIVTLATSVPIFLVPRQLAALPDNKINLPNKEYWLAPERRQESIEYITTQMGWFGVALLALLFYAFYIAAAANLKSGHSFDTTSFLFGLGAFFAFLTIWLTRLLGHFRKAE